MAETVLFESQAVEGFSDGFVEIYPAPFVLVVGETYRVVWDGVEHTLVALDDEGVPLLSDMTTDESGNITGISFIIGYGSPALTGMDGGVVAMEAYDLTRNDWMDTAESHTMAVYQVVADDAGDEEEGYGKQAAVILNYSRNPVYYPSVPKVWLTHPDSTEEAPVLVPYTYGEAVSKTVEPDFTDGDMAVPIGEGELVTELTVVKPEELVPENVRAGKTIAGIDGSYAGAEGAPLEVALDFSGGDTMEFTPEEGVAYSRVTIPKPENLTPENIAEGIDIAGVVGTLAAGGGGSGALVYTAVKTFNVTPTYSGYKTLLVSASDLADCGIDLTQYTSWYQSGQAYVPFIQLTKLKNTGAAISTSYRCYTNAWISNIQHVPSSGTNRVIGDIMYDTESGVSLTGSTLMRAIAPGTATNPLALHYSYAYTGQCLYVSDGSVYAALYYSSSVRYGLYGRYLVTVMLIPAA